MYGRLVFCVKISIDRRELRRTTYTRKMTGISALPVELIHQICRHVRGGGGDDKQVDYCRDWVPEQKALKNLCRTSKAFDRIARPVLYARVEISLIQETFPSFLRTLARRSDLSERVRHLKLKGHDGNRYRFDPTPAVSFADIFLRWWPGGSHHPDFYDGLCGRKKPADALYILVPNVVTMRICTEPWDPTRRREAIPSRILLHMCRLRDELQERFAVPLGRLTLLEVGCHNRPGLYHRRDVRAIFPFLPASLASLTIRGLRYVRELESLHANLWNLALYNCVVDGHEMDRLMEACRGLGKFAYTARERSGATPKECITALKHRSNTLVELYLLVRDGDPLFGAYGGNDEAYDSFGPFTRLKILSVHPSDFVRLRQDFGPGLRDDSVETQDIIDTLPKSLEVFNVVEWFPLVTGRLVRVGELATGGDLPNLRSLEVQSYRTSTTFNADMIVDELHDFQYGYFTLPLRISVYDGHAKEPLAAPRLASRQCLAKGWTTTG
ncbi:hypothetical protein LY78DRAFT_250920 [Colletotrichum sublineola]|nr:hypothetical protein LY78DRAFT_250920 [Colletotrichum sublineola]